MLWIAERERVFGSDAATADAYTRAVELREVDAELLIMADISLEPTRHDQLREN